MRVWILDQLADMAQRAGDDVAAEGYFQAALHASPADGYTKADYADLLLRQGRAAEVLHRLQGDEQQDNLLLRLAIAATRLRTSQAPRLGDEFQARYEAARRDGDTTHLREQARFLLEVRGNAAAALEVAAITGMYNASPPTCASIGRRPPSREMRKPYTACANGSHRLTTRMPCSAGWLTSSMQSVETTHSPPPCGVLARRSARPTNQATVI